MRIVLPSIEQFTKANPLPRELSEIEVGTREFQIAVLALRANQLPAFLQIAHCLHKRMLG